MMSADEPNGTKFLLAKMLLVLFVGLKLTGNIDWSWWWVLSPVFFSMVLHEILRYIESKLGEVG